MMLIGEQELHLKEKQRRAEEKRNIKLKEKVRKAQEEEAKVSIIYVLNMHIYIHVNDYQFANYAKFCFR